MARVPVPVQRSQFREAPVSLARSCWSKSTLAALNALERLSSTSNPMISAAANESAVGPSITVQTLSLPGGGPIDLAVVSGNANRLMPQASARPLTSVQLDLTRDR